MFNDSILWLLASVVIAVWVYWRIARQSNQLLVQQILKQVDLTVVSPFVVNGPVAEGMFFGRDAEIKRLISGQRQPILPSLATARSAKRRS